MDAAEDTTRPPGEPPRRRDAVAVVDALSRELRAVMAACAEAVSAVARERAGSGLLEASERDDVEPLLDALEQRLGRLAGDHAESARLLERYASFLAARERPAVTGPGSVEATAPAPEAPAEPAPDGPASPPGRDTRPQASAGIRLLATQMWAAGASRSEIARRLRDGFGIAGAEALVAAILDD